ncbi:MAG TPA: cell division protein FtsQ [Cyanobacteria bacterium UBA11149]|nr:cell division protein FtsQ [Cyanobacteria bacterium UBA11367]HBE57466.1 cell division protein FtsQ [Cyanobacteria bacterium UBA11366]HBK64528.1 cell division protein FtsQ [Cyanobacteria bacterium UBA11166]HBR74184.1 cell division protein FtsQ [Cyanobacteria bacterium UBA11159]HBS68626.1 cell division protein FtsQ [Cyanobacteria bacterium UBA11153]HBW88401.1 cell division protein FtsQ [Cyanobacteria bacterium UBA11149]HCA95760.1 cell division protein FtsQ [Cyanobacteria bacterium UBA9226]
MANIASVSQLQLTSRREKLRRARRIKFCQDIWRSLFVTGIASSLVWAITLPDWVIRQPEQIVIEGNHLLSAQAIRKLLPLAYPQSLLRLEPQAIADTLEQQAPIAHAIVTRQLVPPGLTVQVQERKPVAIAQLRDRHQGKNQIGFLDAQGVWMPQSSYSSVKAMALPTLKIIGSREQYRPYWREVYQAIGQSPVKIIEIDWQNPANLILKTELGKVHFGPYSSRFPEQLRVLDRMRDLPTQIANSQIAYIDIKNPDRPLLQMVKEYQNSKPDSD